MLGNVVSITDAKSHTSTFTYDTFGRPLSTLEPKDAANDVYIFTPGPTYDGNDNVVREESATGAVAEMGHDPADRVAYLLQPRDGGSAPERMTTYEYDPVGNLLRKTEPKARSPRTGTLRQHLLLRRTESADPGGRRQERPGHRHL